MVKSEMEVTNAVNNTNSFAFDDNKLNYPSVKLKKEDKRGVSEETLVSETNKHVLSLDKHSKASAMTMVNQLSQQIKSKSQKSANNNKSQTSQAKLKYEVLDTNTNHLNSDKQINTNDKTNNLFEKDKSQSNSNSPTKLEKRVDDIVDKCDKIFKSDKNNTQLNVAVKKESPAKSDVTENSKITDKQKNKTNDLKEKNNKKSKKSENTLDCSEKSATLSPRIEVSGNEDIISKQKKDKNKSSKLETIKSKKDIDSSNIENK